MDIHKPLRAVMFSYDLLRLLFLAAAFSLFSVVQSSVNESIFPYMAYLSSNALFPLMCFFLFYKNAEHVNYLPLYIAGKSISVVLFFMWAFFFFPYVTGVINRDNYSESVILLGGIFFISLGDILSILGIWFLNKKYGGS